MEKELIINRLPAKTWNYLKMNETHVTAETESIPCTSEIWCVEKNNAEDAKENIRTELPDGVGWEKRMLKKDIKTGMGNQMSELNGQDTADTLTIEENVHVGCSVVFSYRYDAGKNYGNRMQITAGKNSEIEVIFLFTAESNSSETVMHQLLVDAKEGAKVKIYTAQLLGKNACAMLDIGGACEKDASVELLQIQLGAEKLYAGCLMELDGAHSSFTADIGYFADGNDRYDMNYEARHVGKKTESRMDADGILKDSAKKLFRGTIDFIAGCAGAKGAESEDMLLIDENVENQTIPLILCGEEDVEGSHGATIGRLDEQMLFYLGSRGFDQEEAKRLVARARIDALCALIPSEEIQKEIQMLLDHTTGVNSSIPLFTEDETDAWL